MIGPALKKIQRLDFEYRWAEEVEAFPIKEVFLAYQDQNMCNLKKQLNN